MGHKVTDAWLADITFEIVVTREDYSVAVQNPYFPFWWRHREIKQTPKSRGRYNHAERQRFRPGRLRNDIDEKAGRVGYGVDEIVTNGKSAVRLHECFICDRGQGRNGL